MSKLGKLLIKSLQEAIEMVKPSAGAEPSGPVSKSGIDGRAVGSIPATGAKVNPLHGPARWPKRGDTMKFLGRNGYDHELRAAMDAFKIGQEYKVRDCEVGDWSHCVWFEDVPYAWNGVMFEFV